MNRWSVLIFRGWQIMPRNLNSFYKKTGHLQMTGFVGRVKLRTRKSGFDYRRFLDGSGGRFKVSNFDVQNFSAERKRPMLESASLGSSLPTSAPTASKPPPSTKQPSDETEFVQEYMCWRSCTPRARSSRTKR